MQKIILILLAVPLAVNSCNNKKKNNCEGAICTQMFAAVNLTVTDKDGNKPALSDHYTINTETNDTLWFNSGGWPDGAYTVIDDSYVSRMYNRTIPFRFIGMQGAAIVVDELYTISADCCHISKKSGKETVTID
ncbi:MAG: hypothetical protein K8F30_07015 [Taibaiella sp.]|nr:hypothetical protein [Taibaiella sp.]